MQVKICTRKIVNWLWIVLILLNLIGFAAKAVNFLLGHKYNTVVSLVDTSEEMNLPTWFSVELFFVCALLLLLLAAVKKHTGDRWSHYWKSLSIIFFCLSIDDLVGIHEKLNPVVRAALHTSGLFYYGWLVIAIPLCAAAGFLFMRFVLNLSHSFRARVIAAGAVFLAAKIFVEMLKGYYLDVHVGRWPVFPFLTTVGQLGKHVGVLMFISAICGYMKTQPEFSPIGLQFACSPIMDVDRGTAVEASGRKKISAIIQKPAQRVLPPSRRARQPD